MYDSTILQIKKEVESKLSPMLQDWMISISGSGCSVGIKACSDYNKGTCEIQSLLHSDEIMHICAICKSLFNIGSFHPAKSCDLLKKLDSGLVS